MLLRILEFRESTFRFSNQNIECLKVRNLTRIHSYSCLYSPPFPGFVYILYFMYRVYHKRRPIAKKFKVDISHYFTFFIIIELIRNILNFWETGVFFGKPCMCIICPFLRISKKAKETNTKMKERKMRRRRRRVGGIKESIDSLGGMISWTTSVQGVYRLLASVLLSWISVS